MGMFFNVELNSLEDLLLLELNDLYDAEKRLCDALPKMAAAASSPALKQAFQQHFQQTQRQVSRLEQIFVNLGRPASRETCEAMKGLIKEGAEIISASGSPDVKDAALIAPRSASSITKRPATARRGHSHNTSATPRSSDCCK